MKFDFLNIIGLMSGTSMDGIDISLVQTNGIELRRLNKNYFYRYSKKTQNFLREIINKDIQFNLSRKKILDDFVTREHYLALRNLDIIKNCDLVGFHGQTIYHAPKKNLSVQLGDPQKLSKLLKKNVIFDYRSNDISFGGQGAPLAPIYHKYIIEQSNLTLPTCILNVGGVSNITYWDGYNLIGFDTGPGNALMDDYMLTVLNKNFDEDGNIASSGYPINNEIKKFLENKFFKQSPPKSLDRGSFLDLYEKLIKKKYLFKDVMATLAEFTAETVASGIELLPKKVNNILITGGGYKNNYLMKKLKERLKINFIYETQLGLNFDYIEAELIAYLSARSIYKQPFTFPSTTGVSKPLSGGKLYKFS